MKIAVGAVILALIIPAQAHDYARPELKSWFMGLHNSNGMPCCDGEDAAHVEDADWDTECDGVKKDEPSGAISPNCHYRVRLEDHWYIVPDDAVVTGPNKSGTALVWAVRYGGLPGSDSAYGIRCFMPGSGT